MSALVTHFQPPKLCHLNHIVTGPSGLLGLGAGREPVTRGHMRYRDAGTKISYPDAYGMPCSLEKKKIQLPSFIIFSLG